jgi:Tfp pilus assembly protein PilF
MKHKRSGIFSLALFLFLFFSAFQSVSGQDYNMFTLDFFKRSIECLINGDYDNAIINSNNVIRRDPNSAVAHTIRARAYYEKGDMANAITDCTQAIRLDRNNISAYSIRASAYARAGNRDRAVSDWQAILRINPENHEAKRNIDLITRNE